MYRRFTSRLMKMADQTGQSRKLTQTARCHTNRGKGRLHLRDAVESDYENIVAINRNVYNGFDPLPFLFHQRIRHPNRRGSVCEIDGTIVGFSMYFIVDNGTTLVGEWARTAPEFKGQDIWGQLRSYMTIESLKTHPNLKRVHASNTNESMYQRCKEGYNSYSVAIEWKSFQAEAYSLQLSSRQKDTHAISDGTTSTQLLETAMANPKLFPWGMIMVSWTPFLAIPENVHLIQELSTRILCTTEERVVKNLSIMQIRNCEAGVRVDLNLYSDGTLANSDGDLINHIHHHVEWIENEHLQKDIFFRFIVHDNVNINSIASCAKGMNFDSKSNWELERGFTARTPVEAMIKSRM